MNLGLHTNVSAGIGLLCAVTGGVFWLRGRQQTPRVCVALMIAAGIALASSPIGGWIRAVDTWLDNTVTSWAGHWVALAPMFVATALAIVSTYEVYAHVYRHKRVSGKTLLLALLLPIQDVAIPGTLGAVVMFVINLIAFLPVGLISYVLGMGW